MFVRLMNPVTGNTIVLEVVGEVHYQPKGAMTMAQQHLWREEAEPQHDTIRLVVHADPSGDAAVELTEITLPAVKSRGAVLVLTNWHATLVSDDGTMLERIHDHVPPQLAPPRPSLSVVK